MPPDDWPALIAAALAVRQQAYCPYSNFAVGAALRTASGAIAIGCNVENASFGLTICAERAAVTAAIARGERQFSGLALATAGGHSPCGACRQVLSEFAPDLPVLLVDALHPSRTRLTQLAELLPGRFVFPP